jgi:peptidylprolyl isomerase
MARSANPNSANSQFFIMYAPGEFLNGEYTVVGHVISGMEVVDAIKKGSPDLNGAVENPDRMVSVTVE